MQPNEPRSAVRVSERLGRIALLLRIKPRTKDPWRALDAHRLDVASFLRRLSLFWPERNSFTCRRR